MNAAVQARKAALRHQLRQELKGVNAAERAAASAAACALLRNREEWQRARSILFYAPLRAELDVWPLLEEALANGRAVCLPRFKPAEGFYEAAQVSHLNTDLVPGLLGIREPAGHCPVFSLNRLDLALVPGVGFDSNGRRLGRGKGFYDRLLATASGVLCGVAMDRQLLPAIPAEPHDRILDCILTPTRWLTCARARSENELAG